MIALVRAEWTKVLSTKVALWLLVAACLMTGGFTVLFTALAGESDGPPAVGTDGYDQLVASLPAQAIVFAFILGVIGMTQEYRHRTATPTFLTSPRRGRVVAAKLVAYAVVGAIFAVALVLVVVVVASVYAGGRGAAPDWTGDTLGVLLRSGLATVVYAVIGVGVGALLRNQVGAVVGGLVYLFVAEPILRTIPATQDAYRYLPGGALEAMTASFQGPELLTAWQGGLLLLGYGLVAAALGTVLAVRRDVV